MLINKAFKVEIKPNNRQCTLLEKSIGVARFAYNWGLAERIKLYEKEKKFLTGYDQVNILNSIKKLEFPWMYEVSKWAGQSALVDLDEAYKNFFRGLKQGEKIGFPKFKSKHKNNNSFRISGLNNINMIYITKSTINIPKVGKVRLKQKNYIPTENVKYNNMTISKKADKWFVSVSCIIDIPEPPKPETVLGIDVGIKTLATCSNGETFENNKFSKKSQKQLAHAQKNLARKQFDKETKRSSKNRKKAILKVQKIHLRIANQRKDAINKMTSSLVRTKPRYFALENLNVNGMLQNHKLAGAISDAAFYEIKRQMLYKTLWYGGEVLDINRFFPSSKTCRMCGNIKDDLTLGDRMYICECGNNIDRDLNASICQEGYGISTLGSRGIKACGESVRLLEDFNLKAISMKQEININPTKII